jgi:hypothetical protein
MRGGVFHVQAAPAARPGFGRVLKFGLWKALLALPRIELLLPRRISLSKEKAKYQLTKRWDANQKW